MKNIFQILLGCMVTILFGACIGNAVCQETPPWGVERIRTPCVWDQNNDLAVDNGSNTGDGVRICVIDSGIDYDDVGDTKVYHPDLNGTVVNGTGFQYGIWGFVREVSSYEDLHGHGTHVAGTIAAVDNHEGVIGAAPKVKLYVVKCYNIGPNGDPYSCCKEVVSAINWAITQGVHIISMSLGFETNYTELFETCNNAYNEGILLIAAAGNSGTAVLEYPAAYYSVVAVGAVCSDLTRWEYSCYGPELEFVAPGVLINSTTKNGQYFLDNGTSMAVPHVTAVAALIYSSKIDPDYDINMNNQWDNFEVRNKMQAHALDLNSTGRDNETGYGFINGWATNQRPLGDINIDYKTDIKDIFKAAKAHGSYPEHPNWDRAADIDVNNKVDTSDLFIISKNYGKVDP